MGGVRVSRARRVRCGAVLLPSRLLPFSSAAFVCRRSLPPRVRGRALTFHTFSSCSVRPPSLPTGVVRLCSHACRRRQTAASAARVRRPGGRNRSPSPLQVLAAPICMSSLFLPFARLREIRRCPPPPRLPPLHLSVVVLRRLRALPFPSLYVTCVYFSTAVKR